MAKRRPANKGKKCVRFGKVNGKKVCRKFGTKTATKRRRKR